MFFDWFGQFVVFVGDGYFGGVVFFVEGLD